MSRERIRQIVAKAGETPRAPGRAEQAIERAAVAAGEREAVLAERYEHVAAISAMWIAGEPCAVIARALGRTIATSAAGASWVAYHRRQYPDLFPLRRRR